MKHRPDAKQYRIFTPGEQRRRRREKKKINRNLDPLSCYPFSNSANDPRKNFLQEFEIKSLVDGTGHKSTGKPTDLPPRCFLTISVTFQPYQSNNGNIVVQILTSISLQNSYDSNISITILDRKFKKIFYSILLFPTKITLNSPLHIRFHRVRKNAVSIFFLFFSKSNRFIQNWTILPIVDAALSSNELFQGGRRVEGHRLMSFPWYRNVSLRVWRGWRSHLKFDNPNTDLGFLVECAHVARATREIRVSDD